MLAAVLAIALVIGLLTIAPPAARAADGDDTLSAGEVLTAGQSLVSTNGAFRAVVQGDGNVVVYGQQGPRWWTGTTGRGAKLVMQKDGNVVLYADGGARWWTGTSGADGRLVMQSDGNLVLYVGQQPRWSVATGLLPVQVERTSILKTDQVLESDRSLVSRNGQFVATMQSDDNFVLYGPGNRPLFSTGTSGTEGARLVMQSDGNLVLYGRTGPRWQTASSGSGGYLQLQDDGNLVVLVNGGKLGWISKTAPLPSTPERSVLRTGESLANGQKLVNGRFVATMQVDGNFVVYDGSRAVFATGTAWTNPGRVVMQSDGNLVLYAADGPRWQSGTRGANAELHLQGDGNLVIYAGGRATWSIRTGAIPVTTFPGTGIFAVGRDVAPGTYRTRTATPECAWARLLTDSEDGTEEDILSFEVTDRPAVATIKPTDPFFGTDGCAEWTADLSPLTSSPTAPFSDGTWIVGSDIAAGTWAPSNQGACTWARLSTFASDAESLIDFQEGWTQGAVEIKSSDAGFYADGCGTWRKVG